MLYKYNDFINKGISNKATYLDEDWIILSPLKRNERPAEDYDPDERMPEIINDFDRHIKFMQKYPDIFPETKKLDKYRAAIRKVDISKAEEEIQYIHNKLLDNKLASIKNGITKDYLLKVIYDSFNSDKYILQINFLKDSKDPLIIKWYKFLLLMDEKMRPELGILLDLYPRNIGIDKEGKIKLIDF